MERVHYRRYTPGRLAGHTVGRPAGQPVGYAANRAARPVSRYRRDAGGLGTSGVGGLGAGGVDAGAGATGATGFRVRFLTQTVICAIILAAVMGLVLLDTAQTAQIRARLAAVLSYQIGTEQLTENLQGFIAENFSLFPSYSDIPEMLPGILTAPPEEETLEILPQEMLAEEVLLEETLLEEALFEETSLEEALHSEILLAVEAPPVTIPAAETRPDWLNPLHGYITSLFGPRINPVTGSREFHNGIDIAAAIGTPVLAVRDAAVAHVGYTRLNGNYMRIVCNEGYDIVYAHLDKVLAEPGARVAQGEKIAYSGNTGLSTGPHLHFGIFKNGEMLDPLRRVDLPLSEASASVYAARN